MGEIVYIVHEIDYIVIYRADLALCDQSIYFIKPHGDTIFRLA
jgi:hypothetical protein